MTSEVKNRVKKQCFSVKKRRASIWHHRCIYIQLCRYWLGSYAIHRFLGKKIQTLWQVYILPSTARTTHHWKNKKCIEFNDMTLDSPSILFVIALRNVLNLLAMLFFRLNLALIFSNKPWFFKLTDLELQDQLPYEADYSRVYESSIRIFFSRTTPCMQSSSFSSTAESGNNLPNEWYDLCVYFGTY